MLSHVTSTTTGDLPLIDDPQDPRVRRIADVLRAGARARRTIVIDDLPNILEAMRAGVQIEEIYVTRPALASQLDSAGADGPPTFWLDPAVAVKLFGGEKKTRVFALAFCPPPWLLNDVLERSGDVLILDGVCLPGNIGALVRTAAALDAAGVVLVNSGLASITDRRVIRASRGFIFHLPVVLASSAQLLDLVRSAQLVVVSLSATATAPISRLAAMNERVAILLGSERDGPSAVVDALAAHRLSVPMNACVESLNVSVAGALALYERRRQDSISRHHIGRAHLTDPARQRTAQQR